MAQAVEGLAQEQPGKNIMVFSHGGVIDIASRIANGLALDAVRPDPILNPSINQIVIDNDTRWHMPAWGQTEPLALPALDGAFYQVCYCSLALRSEEGRVGKECARPGVSWWSPSC